MIVYKANKTNFSFYEKDEVHTKDEWKEKLNVTDKEFDAIAQSDFTQVEDASPAVKELIKTPTFKVESFPVFIIKKEKGSFTAQEIDSLSALIDTMLEDFNI